MRQTRILVVDDEVALREVLRDWLMDQGYDVDGAHDGEEALLKVRSFAPDLVVTNRNMPKLTGEEFAARLVAERLETRLIVATGYRSAEIAEAFYRAGACDLLLKPFTIAVLLQSLKRAIGDPLQTNLHLVAQRGQEVLPGDSRFTSEFVAWWEERG